LTTYTAIASFEHHRSLGGRVDLYRPVPLYIGQRIGEVWARSAHEALDAACERADAQSAAMPGGLGSLLRVEVIGPGGEMWVRDLGMAKFIREWRQRSSG